MRGCYDLSASLRCPCAQRVAATGRKACGMAYFVQQLINGITLGAIYGLIAIGYTMVYGIIGMVNFAHGEVFMIGSFVSLIFILLLGVTGASSTIAIVLILVLVLAIAMTVTAVWGWTVERLAYRPLRGSFRLAPLISAIGMSLFLQNLVQVAQGARSKPLANIIQGSYTIMEEDGFTTQLSNIRIVIILVTVTLMAVFTYLIARTPLGRAQRACEQDAKMASLLGVNVDQTISLTFVMGAMLAAVGGMMFLLYYGSIDFYIGFNAGIKAFTAAVLGGIGSLPGAILGGLFIGLVEALWSGYFTVEFKDVAAYSILALVLIFMPSGLLGRPQVEKV